MLSACQQEQLVATVPGALAQLHELTRAHVQAASCARHTFAVRPECRQIFIEGMHAMHWTSQNAMICLVALSL